MSVKHDLKADAIFQDFQGRGRVGTGHNFATKKQDYEDEESNKTGKGWHKHAADIGR